MISDVTPEGVPYSAGLGWVADRIARQYELVAQAKKSRGHYIRGRRVIAVDGFRQVLYRRGYQMGVFRRIHTLHAPAGAEGRADPDER